MKKLNFLYPWNFHYIVTFLRALIIPFFLIRCSHCKIHNSIHSPTTNSDTNRVPLPPTELTHIKTFPSAALNDLCLHEHHHGHDHHVHGLVQQASLRTKKGINWLIKTVLLWLYKLIYQNEGIIIITSNRLLRFKTRSVFNK